MRKIQLTVGAIDTRIKNLKKEVTNLEAGYERLPFWYYWSQPLQGLNPYLMPLII